jgi:hypothetical protein
MFLTTGRREQGCTNWDFKGVVGQHEAERNTRWDMMAWTLGGRYNCGE